MRLPKTLTFAAIAAASVPAFAAAPAAHNFSSRVSVTGMTYELIDLRPDDGIAPAATFIDGMTSTSVEMLYGGKFAGENHFTTTPLSPSFSSHMAPGGSAASAAGMGNGLTLFTMGAGSRLGGKSSGALTSYETSAWTTSYGLHVMLAPGTEMRWTGSFEMQANADKWWGSRWSQSAGAQLDIYHREVGAPEPEGQTFYVSAFANPRLGKQHSGESGTFTFSHVNAGSEWASYSAAVNASTLGGYNSLRAEAGVSPIPEPSTYALFAAGIGAVGFVAKRRRQAA